MVMLLHGPAACCAACLIDLLLRSKLQTVLASNAVSACCSTSSSAWHTAEKQQKMALGARAWLQQNALPCEEVTLDCNNKCMCQHATIK
jgi:hypothetical protein